MPINILLGLKLNKCNLMIVALRLEMWKRGGFMDKILGRVDLHTTLETSLENIGLLCTQVGKMKIQ